jgi:predicted nucleic acid-binding protein
MLLEMICKDQPKSGQIWDHLLYVQALENQIEIIYTKNIKHFPKTDFIQVIDPTA